MQRHTRSLVLIGTLLATLTAVSACGASSSNSTNAAATATSAAAMGGMNALISAAKAEGQLNVIALPLNWANYGTIIKDFEAKYGIKVNQANPQGSSQDEINAVNSEAGTSNAPDVLDIGMAVAWANTSLFAPYKVAEWSDIPASQKDANGLWYQDYGGYMSIGYDSSKYTITSVSDLLSSSFRSAVALNGDPTEANAALNGVMLASLANGGSLDNIGPGVSFFQKLNAAGNFVPVAATAATIDNGTTPVVFNWDYLNSASVVNLPSWKVFVPSGSVLGGYYAQAITKTAPHPAAARLWEEYLYSTAGQNLWLQGGARPVEMTAMQAAGTINQTYAAALPPVSGTPVFLDQSQAAAAATYLGANWAQAVGS
ncbi:MAG: ABC transporter substrate-binding protein [Candidatus Dormibacteria bacterium]